ncbi:leucine-rich repeat domain-containing protein [Niabella ginsengisoli]|uniref:Leucine-rich repeat protein n=1 Tax=Niabella ginsengisoli TaxID=522298 RepID=A0ABS9SFP4_9BACT|nr:leucine-rich repeat domain-containing protein [Niabella ginsengisoli]MCH5597191.1 leucine-rich repeat protein [Niabella ginsengisoli]
MWLKREAIIPEKLSLLTKMPNLKYLTLTGGSLSMIPPEIYKLKNLRSLTISGNKLKIIPKDITRLQNLERLSINNAGLREIPKWVTKVKYLKSLDLSENDIHLIGDDTRFNPSLQYLNLSYNQLNELPKSISQLKKLSRLNIRNNRFEIFPNAIIFLPKLKALEIENNQLTQLPELSKMLELERLYISRNPLTEQTLHSFPLSLKSFYAYDCSFTAIPQSLKNCRDLETLIITNGNITTIPDWIPSLNSLKWLNLEKNEIEVIPIFLKQMAQLEKLILSNNRIDSIPPEIFEASNLVDFSIDNNPVRHIPDAILQAKSLKYLTIEKTLIPKEEYTRYRKTLAKKPVIITADDKQMRYAESKNRKDPCYAEDEIFEYDIFTKTEVAPSFKGRPGAGSAFFNQNLNFPNISPKIQNSKSWSDTVVLKFVVKPWGGITKITPVSYQLEQTKEEATRLLKLSCPNWQSGFTGSRTVLAWCWVQFIFRQSLDEPSSFKKELFVKIIPRGSSQVVKSL